MAYVDTILRKIDSDKMRWELVPNGIHTYLECINWREGERTDEEELDFAIVKYYFNEVYERELEKAKKNCITCDGRKVRRGKVIGKANL